MPSPSVRTVTATFKSDELEIVQDIEAEAVAKGFTLSGYAKVILQNRDLRKRLVVNPDVEVLKSQHDKMIDVLREQISELTERLEHAGRETSLQGLEQANQTIQEQILAGIETYKQGERMEALNRQVDELQKKVSELETENEELNDDLEALESEKKELTEKVSTLGIIKEVAPSVMSGLAGRFPIIGKVIEGGLSGIAASNLSDEDRRMLEQTKQYNDRLNDEQKQKMAQIIDFLTSHQEFIDKNYEVIQRSRAGAGA